LLEVVLFIKSTTHTFMTVYLVVCFNHRSTVENDIT